MRNRQNLLRNKSLTFWGHLRSLQRLGRLFFICVCKNWYDQTGLCQNQHKNLIITHNIHPFLKFSDWMKARPPAPWVTILDCLSMYHSLHLIIFYKVYICNYLFFICYSMFFLFTLYAFSKHHKKPQTVSSGNLRLFFLRLF